MFYCSASFLKAGQLSGTILVDLEKLELFAGQFYPVILNKGHKSLKS
jgi:hypothetical protein